MMDYISQNLWLFWSIITFLCLIMELSSGDFYVTCFAIGALVSILTAVVGLPFWMQVLIWAVCSVLSIWLVRPHLLHALHKGAEERKSNADALLGQVGEVTQTIVAGDYGRVKLDGDDWKAEAPGIQTNLEVGTKVKVIGRESIILKVERC
jgi:membrane protein implicated in regulation of membrane protease activity